MELKKHVTSCGFRVNESKEKNWNIGIMDKRTSFELRVTCFGLKDIVLNDKVLDAAVT